MAFQDIVVNERSRYFVPICASIAIGCLICQSSSATLSGRLDCDTSRYPLSSPTNQFEDDGDGTVVDKHSNLMWMRCAVGQSWNKQACSGDTAGLTWAEAAQAAKLINQSGKFFYSDWRLPQLPELASISERQCKRPRINLDVFPSTAAAYFWSATSRPSGAAMGPPDRSGALHAIPQNASGSGSQFAFAFSFGPDGVIYANKEEQYDVRFVRSAR